MIRLALFLLLGAAVVGRAGANPQRAPEIELRARIAQLESRVLRLEAVLAAALAMPRPTAPRALSASGRSAAPLADLPNTHLYGSRSGETFHLARCSTARRVKPNRRVTWPSLAAATQAGRRPCSRCHPESVAR